MRARTIARPSPPRQRFSRASLRSLGMDAPIYFIVRLAAMPAAPKCSGAGLSIETGDGLYRGTFYAHQLAAASAAGGRTIKPGLSVRGWPEARGISNLIQT